MLRQVRHPRRVAAWSADDGGLANVFVYVRTPKVGRSAPSWPSGVAKRVTLDNRDCIFKPHCLKIWYDKQEFYTVNSDPVAQNVAFSPLGDVPANIVLAGGRQRDLQVQPQAERCRCRSPATTIPGRAATSCRATIPTSAISAADGTFRIAEPAGRASWSSRSWHERVGYLDTPQWPKGRLSVTIKPGANDLGTIKIHARLVGEEVMCGTGSFRS